jgi:hypothetical protein
MDKRIAAWLMVFALCSPMVLMAWYPDIFTVGLRFVLRYHIELALPLWMHAYGLWVAYSRRSNPRSRFAFVAYCCISIAAFGYLAHSFTYQVFWVVTVVPAIYIIMSDLLSGKSRLLGHNT